MGALTTPEQFLIFRRRISRLTAASGRFSIGLAVGVYAGIAGPVALAGEYTRTADGKGVYQLETCSEPEAPEISLNPKKRGRASIRDYNRQVAKMNAYLAEVQSFMTCMTDEANRDLDAFYGAVNERLEAHQLSLEQKTASMRATLAPGPNPEKKRRQNNNDAVPALEGAPEPGAAPDQEARPAPVREPDADPNGNNPLGAGIGL